MTSTLPLFLAASVLYAQDAAPLTGRERALLDRVAALEQRVAALEGAKPAPAEPGPAAAATTSNLTPAATAPASSAESVGALPGFLAGTTLNFNFDGYYESNFNRPLGRVNLLRAYDPTSNNFSINQAGIVVERAPDVANGRRFGLRLDLQYGQATETLQGNPLNEPRPQVYRNLFQAYGTYVLPVGSGLTVDFGKWASTLGTEGNYTKDQINYTRSFFFELLPFYHNGFRAAYKWNDRVQGQYWLVNGGNQTEGFNGFKSNAFLLAIAPAKTFTWNINYFFGQQGRDLVPDLNPGIPELATQPGLSTTRIYPTPNGREHILDTYASWNATNKLMLTAEGDYVVNRQYSNAAPVHVFGGAGYVKYQLTPKFAIGNRFEYLSDRGGLFSGQTQAVKDETLTALLQAADGFQLRWEYRIDFSNQLFFLTHTPGILKRDQNTALMGMTWWFGAKQGAW